MLAALLPIIIMLLNPVENIDWIYHFLYNDTEYGGAEHARPAPGGFRITEEAILQLDESDCLYRFRFYADELLDLSVALQIPEVFITKSRHRFSALEALCLVLAYYKSAGNQYDLTMLYQRSQAAISEVVIELSSFLNDRWGHLLDVENNKLLSPNRLVYYADSIYSAGAPMRSLYGFIDCTIRQMCRPSEFQRQAYNGYKKVHALKYQSVVLPNGMIGCLYGPEVGRHNDNYLLAQSGLLPWARQHAVRPMTNQNTPPEDRFLQVFGDPAYGNSYQIISPYAGIGRRTDEQREWNAAMSSVRTSVEHGFGIITRLFPSLNAWWKNRILSSPLGVYYRVAVLLANAHNCLRPNQTAQKFNCFPPSLEEYFSD